MAAVSINRSQPGIGHVIVESNVISGTVTINMTWDDDPGKWGDAVGTVIIYGLDQEYIIPTPGGNGSASQSFPIKGANHGGKSEFVITWNDVPGGSIVAVSDTVLEFRDTDGTDANAVATFTFSNIVLDGGSSNQFEGPTSCPPVLPWTSVGLPASCPSPPSQGSITTGLQISATGNKRVSLNLKNYENKLVTLKVVVNKGSSWQQSMRFNIPQASDILVNNSPLGGDPYAKSAYNNTNLSSATTIWFYNIDGGDYNYVFEHDSVTGPRPTRVNYTYDCSTNTETVVTDNGDGTSTSEEVTTTICTCNEYTETYGGNWPHCPVGVAIVKNGSSVVRWAYSDGSGSTYNAQIITMEVMEQRDVVPLTGGICVSTLKQRLWLPDPVSPTKVGNCIADYKDHSLKRRFRNPASRSSRTTITSPVCFSTFRGLAGAKPPII